MKSHEVLRNTFEETSPKEVASELGVSLSLIYKWSEGSEESGSRNPLDRVIKLYEATKDPEILHWICKEAGGYFVRNPNSMCEKDLEVMPATNEIIRMFSELLAVISKAATDRHIDDDESERIRLVWDKLKSYTEGFVTCCEEGDFQQLEESEEGVRLIPK